jgi:transcriptional regulator with XRE-family HTH domain
MQEDKKTFKQRLTDELAYQGLSNKEFAQRVGISLSTLGMYLYRGSIPSADVAVKMAQILNTTVEYLIFGTENSKFLNHTGSKSEWQKKEINMIINSLNQRQLNAFLEIARVYKNILIEKN